MTGEILDPSEVQPSSMEADHMRAYDFMFRQKARAYDAYINPNVSDQERFFQSLGQRASAEVIERANSLTPTKYL